MLNVSATSVAVGTHCSETTDEICGSVGPNGCTIPVPPIPNSPVKSSATSESAGSGPAKGLRDPNEESSASGKIAAAVGIPFVMLLVSTAVVYFIVLPWVRGVTRSEPSTSRASWQATTEIAPSIRSASFEEENNYVEHATIEE
jgi:hypothetical protein